MKNKIIVIHGHENCGYDLSDDSLARCEHALSLLERGEYSSVICSGGLFSPSQGGVTNASAMGRFFESKASETNLKHLLILEWRSTTTIHNVEEVCELLLKEEPIDELTVVSSSYHARRVAMIWSKAYKKRVIFSNSSKVGSTLKKSLVEFIGIIVTFLYFHGFKSPEMHMRDKRIKSALKRR